MTYRILPKKYPILLLLVVVALSTGLIGCGGTTDKSKDNSKETQKEPIKIGALVSLTTGFSVEGLSQANGIKLAIQEINAKGGINGQPIDLIIEDVANSNTVAINALNKVLNNNPVAIMGPIWGTMMLAYDPTIKQNKVPILTVSGSRKVTQQGNEWVFRYFPHDGIAKVAQTKFAIEKMKAKKPAILYVADEYGMSGRDIILETLKKYNIEPVAVESMNATDKDASGQLMKIKNSGADVLLLQNHSADLAVVLRQAKQLGLKCTIISGSAASQPATINILSEEILNGLYAETAAMPTIDPDPQVKSWVERYKKAFNSEPDSFALLDYDATMMLIEAIKKVGPDRDKIRELLKNMSYKGLGATYTSDKEGNMIHQSVIIKFEGSNPSIVDRIATEVNR